MYTLYYSPGSASLVVHAALKESGAPYELARVDMQAGLQRSPEYLKLNPQGKVPTLVVDGTPLHESAALLMLLADRHPGSGLGPAAGTLQRGEWYELLVTMSNTLGTSYRLWFYPAETGNSEPDSTVRNAVRQRIESMWATLDARLADNGPYLLGDQFSAADLLLTMYMRWSRNMPRPATDWPALRKFADLMRARPSWQHVTEVEALTGW